MTTVPTRPQSRKPESRAEFLQVQFLKCGLWIKAVDVARTALHHQKDAVFGLGGHHLRFRRERAFLLSGEQRRQSHASERGAESIHELASRRRMQRAGASTGKEGGSHIRSFPSKTWRNAKNAIQTALFRYLRPSNERWLKRVVTPQGFEP